MANLYNRPHLSFHYLVDRLRTKAPLWVLGVLATSCLYLLGSVHVPEILSPESHSWGLQGLLAVLQWSNLPGSTFFLLVQTLGSVGGVLGSGALLRAAGFRDGMVLRVCLLLAFATGMAHASWHFGTESLLAAVLAGALTCAQNYRRSPSKASVFLVTFFWIGALLLDPRALVLGPFLVACLAPVERLKPYVLGSMVVCAGLLVLAHFQVLSQSSQVLAANQLALGHILRRLTAAFFGAGSSLFLAAPPLLLCGYGLRRMRVFDPGLLHLTAGSALAYGTLRLLLVYYPNEVSVPLTIWVPILPALAPALAFGLLEIRNHALRVPLLVGLTFLGSASQMCFFVMDPQFLLQQISHPTHSLPLDRSFTPELSPPALSLKMVRTYFAASPSATLSLPSATGGTLVPLSTVGLSPRPWVLKLVATHREPLWKLWARIAFAGFLLTVGLVSLSILLDKLKALAALPKRRVPKPIWTSSRI